MADLSGKIALITGGSRGIGASIARRLASDGADVIITFRDQNDAAQEVLADIRLHGRKGTAIQADAADADAIKSLADQVLEKAGKLDILVNNVGYMDTSGAALANIPRDIVDRTIMVNVRSAFLLSQYVSNHLSEGGRIINISSCLGKRVPSAGLTLYAMTKSAITGLTNGLARDLANRQITVNQISPGPIDTDMSPADGPNAGFFRDLTALARFGTTTEIAAVVSFLTSQEASFITGANIAIDGGTNI
ncbi:SDR family NAD(P)-dependent oxidoreductase [Serratia ureilytica]|uniref:SDR family NAD(P)-dependent oxidoreductase n=1 Tax=Serratia ureilytica TaxID=300181 RepID=UPI001D1966D2|nr:SDR family oxidoreductase [Serratia ureilytica]MCC4105647.1 SDR family oxidoreductase [Serratia ureilytica]